MTSTVEQAKDLLGLVGAPSAVATTVCLAYANRCIRENEGKVEHARMWRALAAAFGGTAIAITVTAVMAPVGLRALFVNRGPVSGVLVLYWILLLAAVGTVCYAGLVGWHCIGELRRPED